MRFMSSLSRFYIATYNTLDFNENIFSSFRKQYNFIHHVFWCMAKGDTAYGKMIFT